MEWGVELTHATATHVPAYIGVYKYTSVTSYRRQAKSIYTVADHVDMSTSSATDQPCRVVYDTYLHCVYTPCINGENFHRKSRVS